ncbi:MAG TPA: hypothetical protein VJQ77_07485 [Novosphingobium sp.]|nr:hypothetical protein [Novosphingobium sp.]
MISALLLVLASPAAAAPGLNAGYASDTIRHLKGHSSLPSRAASGARTAATAACHPDPSKGRACRHHNAKAAETREARVLAHAGEAARGAVAP